MKLSKGDAVTYVALVLSAALQALEPWRKEASMPPDTHPILSSSVWAYVPLALLCLVGIIWLFQRFLPAKQSEPKERSYNPDVEKVAVINKRFVNELVVLDGHSFIDCRFENVNFQFNGTAPFDMRGNTFAGRARLSTTNPVVDVTMIWLKAMGMTADHFEIVTPPGVTVEAPKIHRGD